MTAVPLPTEHELRRLTETYRRLVAEDMGLTPSRPRDAARIIWAVMHGSTYHQAEALLEKVQPS